MKLQNILCAVGEQGESVHRMGPIKRFLTNQRAGGCVFYTITFAMLFAPGFLLPVSSVNWIFNKSIDSAKETATDSSKP